MADQNPTSSVTISTVFDPPGQTRDPLAFMVFPTDHIIPDRNESDSILPDSLLIESTQLNYYYTVLELLVALVACVGNALVITVFHRERRLRKRTNYYIVSLAMADFLVGVLGIPFAILASIGLPTNLYGCLLTLSTLVVLCTISIFCLVAVSIDRYWAILYPLAYSRNVRTKTAICEYKKRLGFGCMFCCYLCLMLNI